MRAASFKRWLGRTRSGAPFGVGDRWPAASSIALDAVTIGLENDPECRVRRIPRDEDQVMPLRLRLVGMWPDAYLARVCAVNLLLSGTHLGTTGGQDPGSVDIDALNTTVDDHQRRAVRNGCRRYVGAPLGLLFARLEMFAQRSRGFGERHAVPDRTERAEAHAPGGARLTSVSGSGGEERQEKDADAET